MHYKCRRTGRIYIAKTLYVSGEHIEQRCLFVRVPVYLCVCLCVCHVVVSQNRDELLVRAMANMIVQAAEGGAIYRLVMDTKPNEPSEFSGEWHSRLCIADTMNADVLRAYLTAHLDQFQVCGCAC